MSTLDLDFTESIVPLTKPLRHGPKKLPLLGNILDIKGDPLKFVLQLARDYGDHAEFYLGANKVLMLNHPAYIKHVLQDNRLNYEKSKYVGLLDPILGGGILLAEGEQWKKQRQTAAQGFKGCYLKSMIGDMTGATGEMIARWRQAEEKGQPIAMLPEMMHVTLDIVLRSLLNVRVEGQYREIYDSLTTILRTAEERIWSLLQPPYWVPTPANIQVRKALLRLHRVVDRIIDGRCDSGERHDDLLQIFIDSYAPDGLDKTARVRLRNQLKTIMLAGHDTTANAMAWTWYLLSKHPAVYRRAKAEVDRILGGRVPTFQDIEKLTYCRMAFKEALRIYPTVWTFSRQAMEDDRIGDLAVRKGTTIMICPYAIHRRPEFYPNPEGFDPERFDPEQPDQLDRFAYLPFGGGPRTCLGNRFADIEAMILMSMVLQNFRLDIAPGQDVEAEPVITLRQKNEVHFTLSSIS